MAINIEVDTKIKFREVYNFDYQLNISISFIHSTNKVRHHPRHDDAEVKMLKAL